MRCLSDHRYVVVLIRKSSFQSLALNPVGVADWISEARALGQRETAASVKWTARKIVSELSPVIPRAPSTWEEVQETAKEIHWEHATPPVTTDEKRYEDSLKDFVTASTELFHPVWKTSNPGAARNAILGRLQLKGCGRTLPVNYLEHIMASGTMLRREALHSFLISQLIETTFPLGGLRSHAVFDGGERGAIFVRDAEAPRLAQLGPDLDHVERESLLKVISRVHGNCDLPQVIRRIMGQYAALALTGGSCNPTPDNFLITGRFVDEEEWCWQRGKLDWSLRIEGDGDHDLVDPEDINWKSFGNLRTTFTNHAKMRRNLLQALSYVGEHSVTEETARSWFLEHLEALGGYTARAFWVEGEAVEDFAQWIRLLKERGFRMNLVRAKFPGRICLRLSGPDLLLDQQSTIGERLEQLISDETDSFALTRVLFHRASRMGVFLPTRPDQSGKPEANQEVLSTYLNRERQRLGEWFERVVALVVLNKEGKEIRSSLSESEELNDVLPISFIVNFDDKGELEIPARKIRLISLRTLDKKN